MSAKLTITIPEWLDKICVGPLMLYRRLKYGFSFRKIYLGENEHTIVEPADYYWVGKFKWILLGTGYNLYAVREVRIGPKKTKRMYLHRAIMKPPKRRLVDHRNTDSLDNRRANLRLATHAQNIYNRRKTSKKTWSRFIGVSFDRNSPAWVSCIDYKRKRIHLGRFDSEIDAARAHDKAARKYHKEFARLNFPEEAPVS